LYDCDVVRLAAHADAWEIRDGSQEFSTLADVAALFATGGASISTTYHQRGMVPPQRIEALVAKGLRALEDGQRKWRDALPEWVRSRYGLPGYLEALKAMHRPESEEQYEAARRRLAFQELMCLQLKLLLQRASLRLPRRGEELAGVRVTDRSLAALGQRALPYSLTGAQRRALEAVGEGMAGWPPMMCLLQGDVGCGKTAVAFLSVLAAVGSGYQAAVMAPTEILAEQHFAGLNRLVGDMRAAAEREASSGGRAPPRLPTVALLTGSTKRAERVEVLAGLASGAIDIVVGTHTLISDPVVFSSLGLAIIDEQHK
jgi:ATP-dependent DNA helicase RecG